MTEEKMLKKQDGQIMEEADCQSKEVELDAMAVVSPSRLLSRGML